MSIHVCNVIIKVFPMVGMRLPPFVQTKLHSDSVPPEKMVWLEVIMPFGSQLIMQ